jgi:hypothetical protein
VKSFGEKFGKIWGNSLGKSLEKGLGKVWERKFWMAAIVDIQPCMD